VPSSFIHL